MLTSVCVCMCVVVCVCVLCCSKLCSNKCMCTAVLTKVNNKSFKITDVLSIRKKEAVRVSHVTDVVFQR